MKFFLLLIILGLCGGGYCGYTILQHRSDADHKQLADQSAKIDALQSDNKKLEDEKTDLTKSMADVQAKIADLTRQLAQAQSALAQAKTQSLPSPAAPAPVATTTPAQTASASKNLGTVTLLDGKSYPNSQVLKIEADGVVVNYTGGITKLYYNLMPPDLQKRFNYDPHEAAARAGGI